MKKLIALALAVLMVLAMTACGGSAPAKTDAPAAAAEERTTFIMGIDPEYPPFSYLGDDGSYTGFDVEICQAACDYLGWDMEIFGVNWDEKLVQLDSFECDCVWSGMTILDSMKDLAELASSFGEVITCDSFLKCFTELAGNSVDAVFVDLPVAASYAAEHDGLRIIDEALGAEQYGIAFRSGDQALCDEIQGAVAALVENGTYAEIAANYPDIVNNLLFLSE